MEGFQPRTKFEDPPSPHTMILEGLGEMFENDSADTCAEKFPLVPMGG
jgi:hypothetical protein